jgi:hypothetical protein
MESEIGETEIPANNQRVAIRNASMAQNDLSRSLHSLKIRWIVCLVSGALFTISRIASGGVSLTGFMFALVGFVYSISCLIGQMKLLRNLKGVGVRANYWYALMLAGLIFLFFGVAIEVGCFLLYVRRIYGRLNKTPAISVAPTPSDSNHNELEVDSQSSKFGDFNASRTLDSDIKRMNGWKRIGIIASVVWVLCAGAYTFHNVEQADIQMTSTTQLACDEANPHDTDKCYREAMDSATRQLPYEREEAAIVALVPVPFAWAAAYLLLFLVRWVRKGFRAESAQ